MNSKQSSRVVAMVSLALLCATSVAAAQHADAPAVDPAQWRLIAAREATASAQDIQDAYRAGEAFAQIARMQSAIGDERGAEASIRTALSKVAAIEQLEFRGWVQHEIVQAQLAIDDVIGARETATAIAADRPHGAAYVLLARRALQAGNVAGAESLAGSIRDREAAGEILTDLVATRAARGDVAAALALQRRIQDRYYAAVAAAHVAIAQARTGDFKQARATVLATPRAERAQAIVPLVNWYRDRGELQRAIDLTRDVDDAISRSLLVARQALDMKRGGEVTGARDTFAAALALLDSVRDESRRRLQTTVQVARLQALADFREEALITLQRVGDQSSALLGKDKDVVTEARARAYLRLGDYARAIAIAADLDDRISRALLVRDAIAQQAAEGPTQEFASNDPLVAAAVQFGLLAARLGAADKDAAQAGIAAAREHIARIGDPLLRPAALSALAAASFNIGDAQLGQEIFTRTLASSVAIERADQRALAYVRVANALNDRLMFLGRPASEPESCAIDRENCVGR